MPYTLKLDWTYERAETVARYLSADLAACRLTSLAAVYLSAQFAGAGPGDAIVLKPDWSSEVITQVQARLCGALGMIARLIEYAREGCSHESSYEDLCADQAQIYAAIGDIADYRAAVDRATRTPGRLPEMIQT